LKEGDLTIFCGEMITPCSKLAAKVREGPLITAAYNYNFGKRVLRHGAGGQPGAFSRVGKVVFMPLCCCFSIIDGYKY
jgi:hypothetical protein